MGKKIGGFFPLAEPKTKSAENILSLWDIPEYHHAFFFNARSALNYLLKLKKPEILWLPAYSCTSITEAIAGTNTKIRYFPLNKKLSPDCAYLKKNVKSGDAVLAIDYFGMNPEKDFLKLVASMPKIVWVEDRAQGFMPAKKSWGDYIIYSPRKLIGVQDGGILVSKKGKLPGIKNNPKNKPGFISPAMLRYKDKGERNNSVWYKANIAFEKSMNVSPTPITKLSYDILKNTDPRPLMKKRASNYKVLMKELGNISFLKNRKIDFVPFGFPIKVKDRKKVASYLHKNNIFAAHHWPELPSPTSFRFEHDFADNIITLPCDHRYNSEDMKMIIKLVKEALK